MSWNYDFSALATSEKDAIRNEVGDTDPGNPLLQDEEILYAISVERNFWAAAARCCEQIARTRLIKADVRLGRNLMITYTKMAEQYYAMAKDLRRKAMGSAVPYFGGVNVSDKQTIASDTGLVAPLFTKTMMENPWVGGYTSDSGPPVANAETEAGEDETF